VTTMLLTEIVSRLRRKIGDSGIYNPLIVPLGAVNGSNTRFHVPVYPLADNYELYNNDALVSSSTYSVNQETGQLTYNSAPALYTVHYITITSYDDSDVTLVNAIKDGIKYLESVWEKTWTFDGSSTTETISEAPADDELVVILLAAEREIVYNKLNKALRIPASITTIGATLARNQVREYRDRLSYLEREIPNFAKRAAIAGLPKCPTSEYGVQWEIDPG
jgi:hypothetical protein